TRIAYFFFALAFLCFLYVIRHFELKRIRRIQQQELEMIEFRKLKELDQLKSRFFTNISHEFRTPLTLILGQIGSVMGSAIHSREKGKLQVAMRNSRRLLTLINQLLDLAKLDAGSMKLRAENGNLVSYVRSLLYSFESLARKKNIQLRFSSEKNEIPVLFEADKLEKVFYNLFSNALKFTPERGKIEVEITTGEKHGKTDREISGNKMTAPDSAPGLHTDAPPHPLFPRKNDVRICVRDFGIGIPEDELPHIFDRFYQGDGSQTREFQGSGIGLALTKELVELHGGQINVSSEVGAGSEFTIYLPVSKIPVGETAKPASTPRNNFIIEPPAGGKAVNGGEEQPSIGGPSIKDGPQKNGHSESILIVEDNPDVRAYIRELLEGGYQVIEAPHGRAGIHRAQETIPDLIITDVMMPEMDGYAFSKEIRQNEKTSHIPLIMLTAKAGLDDKIEGLETGVDDYLTKPFSAKELQVRVKNLILQRTRLRKRFSKATIIKPSEVSGTSMDQAFLQKVICSIEKHMEDADFNVDKLAGEASMSVSQLNRKLGALIDQSAGKLIRSMRLQRGADLLKQNTGTVAEICYQLGFSDQANFTRAFKKQFGVAPGEYKKQ
ncbi:MAG: response regulator, partial [Calditrichia bacterium]